MCLLRGVTASTSYRDPVLCPGSSSGRSAPREALVVRPRPRSGPLGRGAGRLRGGGAWHGAGADEPGQSQQHSEKHAGPTAPQRHGLLPQSGDSLTSRGEHVEKKTGCCLSEEKM